MASTLTSASLVSVMLFALLALSLAASIQKRQWEDGWFNDGMPACLSECGWGIYEAESFTRRVHTFLPNACKCAPTHSCDLDKDDPSKHAYVYRCRKILREFSNSRYTREV
ncbi:PREDICTED: uncharacterized protein LOC106807170 [Priapulus caudatus]|uniref:Uncharacterized protein LOC106807170 n=1 Tax=Priapulus caudatus TaxID=37621 RepID=A0ABM1DYA2_PRICU|nr:PREDICTED: uncharacterized protein LOC106807170 [Priapulus caudatus]